MRINVRQLDDAGLFGLRRCIYLMRQRGNVPQEWEDTGLYARAGYELTRRYWTTLVREAWDGYKAVSDGWDVGNPAAEETYNHYYRMLSAFADDLHTSPAQAASLLNLHTDRWEVL